MVTKRPNHQYYLTKHCHIHISTLYKPLNMTKHREWRFSVLWCINEQELGGKTGFGVKHESHSFHQPYWMAALHQLHKPISKVLLHCGRVAKLRCHERFWQYARCVRYHCQCGCFAKWHKKDNLFFLWYNEENVLSNFIPLLPQIRDGNVTLSVRHIFFFCGD